MVNKPSGSRTNHTTEDPPVCGILSRSRGTILLKMYEDEDQRILEK
jgi:hypothetical protein